MNLKKYRSQLAETTDDHLRYEFMKLIAEEGRHHFIMQIAEENISDPLAQNPELAKTEIRSGFCSGGCLRLRFLLDRADPFPRPVAKSGSAAGSGVDPTTSIPDRCHACCSIHCNDRKQLNITHRMQVLSPNWPDFSA